MVAVLPIYVINLARRPDRLAAISKRLDDAGLAFERIDAVDALAVSDEEIEHHFGPHPGFGQVAKGDRCCTLSHVRTYERFARSPGEYALILEDDAVFEGASLRVLLEACRLPDEVDLVKIESYGPVGRRILVGEITSIGHEMSIARLHSRHTGTGGYIISRRMALWMLAEMQKWPMPIDHVLFNPQVSPVFDRIRPYQLLPAIVRQVDLKTDSDIEAWRRPLRNFSREYVRRELWRFHTDLAALPRQFAQLATGNWRFATV